ncbi:MAG: DUF2149 domain-containing protein [Solirubrobacteraceae bacterium]
MNRHSGLGRHSPIEEAAGDPLDGLVNLFDIGIVLAVAFLVAGLGFTIDRAAHKLTKRVPEAAGQRHTLPATAGRPHATGRGQPVGTVYRLANGHLVYVQKPPARRGGQ